MNFSEIKKNFFAFLAIFTAIGIVGRMFKFDTVFLGKKLSEHISDLMVEHEALKTLFFVSVILIAVGLLRGGLALFRVKSYFIRDNFSIPVSNFIATLAAISVAISVSVYLTSIHMLGFFSVITVLFVLNVMLAGFLIFSLHMFSEKDITIKNFCYGSLSSILYTLILFRGFVFLS